MKLNVLCDAHWESRLDKVMKYLSATGYRNLFLSHDYGKGLDEIIIVLMCRDPELKFKQRIRFVKRKRTLCMDIMLDLDQMRQVDDAVRVKIVVDRLADEVPAILHRYSIADFDEARFIEDMEGWIARIRS